MISPRMESSSICISCIKPFWISHGWTVTFLIYFYASCALCWWKISAQSCVLMFKLGGNVTMPKIYPSNAHCLLTKPRGPYTCHRMPLLNSRLQFNGIIGTRDCLFEADYRPYARLLWLSSYYTQVLQIMEQVYLTYHHRWLWRLKVLIKIPSHFFPGRYLQSRLCWQWSRHVYSYQIAIFSER